MGAVVLEFQVQLVHSCNCITCGVPIVMPADKERWLRETHRDFYCINGHTQVWKQESDVERAQRLQREAEERARRAEEHRDRARHAESIARGKLKAQSERIANGVCPCCHRSFKNLRRHMGTKHPGWNGE